MCGIVGIYNFNSSTTGSGRFIDWALTTMKFRGPDSHGKWNHGNKYYTGFVRLAIRDLSINANQPMVSDCGDFVLTYNGEIYNTDKFRVDLIKNHGIKFKTNSDTEVLLYALKHFGHEKVLKEFDGIFAFALYNKKTSSLLIARDRSGVKPLYIGLDSEAVIFSSQYDHIIQHPLIRSKSVNPGAIGAYLQLGYVPEGSGLLEDTFLLPHGHFIEITPSGVSKIKPYFEFPSSPQQGEAKHLEESISNAVASQLVSDVSIGTFMSGGVDSPLVTYFAKQYYPKIQSFNIGVPDSSLDESEASSKFAALFQTQHHTKYITEYDLLNSLKDNTKAYSEPFADFSSIPTLLLSSFVRKKMTVALSGDGGDELFWGYPRNVNIFEKHSHITASKRQILFRLVLQKFKFQKRVVSSKELRYKDFWEYYYNTIFIGGSAYWTNRIFKGIPEEAFFYKKLRDELGNKDPNLQSCMDAVRKLEFDLHLQRILLKVDRASMYNSLEVRVPLLSNSVIDSSLNYSSTQCVQHNGKYPLKKILSKYSNHNLVYQKKKGFEIPLGKWLNGVLAEDLKSKLTEIPHELSPLFNKSEIQRMIKIHKSGKRDLSWMLWALYSLMNWYEEHRRIKYTL